MKKIICKRIICAFTVIILAILFCLLSTSCRDSTIDDEIQRVIESMYEIIYIENALGDLEGIASGIYSFDNNRYYFTLSKMWSRPYQGGVRSSGIKTTAYIDLATGEMWYICPDPLCTHMPDECKYGELQGTFFVSDDVFYAWRIDEIEPLDIPYYSLYKVDLNNDTVSLVYRCNDDHTKFMLQMLGIFENKLYIREIENTLDSEGRTARTIIRLVIIDTQNDAVLSKEAVSARYSEIFFAYEGRFYFIETKGIFSTNMDFGNERQVYRLDRNEQFSYSYFDGNTGELYFLIRNIADNTGIIYAYDVAKNELKAIDMPSNEIYSFQLTNSKIYCTFYEPIFFGVGNGYEVYDNTGGKVYVVDRNNPAEAELILDVRNVDVAGAVVLNDFLAHYVIIGDYLHLAQPFVEKEPNDNLFIFLCPRAESTANKPEG